MMMIYGINLILYDANSPFKTREDWGGIDRSIITPPSNFPQSWGENIEAFERYISRASNIIFLKRY